MLTYFRCPDGEKIRIEDCLKKEGCRLKRRCLTLATLQAAAMQRSWNGIPSTTQLISGTCEAALKLTCDYTEDPKKSMFKLLGTKVHGRLESEEQDGAMVEGDMAMITSHGISMRPDLLEKEDDWNILTDYKVSGAFKVAKALGVYGILEEHATDIYTKKTTVKNPETGIDEVYSAGDKKMVKKWKQNILRQDCIDWVRQLNYYRIGLQEKGERVDEMRIEAIVRDGGLISARNYGVDENVYLIPIPTLPDQEVITYFLMKKEALLMALKNCIVMDRCTQEECWEGNKCEKYCSVREFCPFMPENAKKTTTIPEVKHGN